MNKMQINVVLCILMAVAFMGTGHAEELEEVRVKPDQTLNEAIADVEGPIKVILPDGVTTHDRAITRRHTVVLEGQGRDRTTLRASADVPLIHQGPNGRRTFEPFEGDLIVRGLTCDRAHHAGRNLSPQVPEKKQNQAGPTIISTAAAGRVVFENVEVRHFDFAGRSQAELIQGLGTPQYKWNSPDMPRHAYVGFHNVTIDFKAGGGVRHRHNSEIGGPGIAFAADKLVFDEESLIQGHLTQHADPEQTVGERPGDPPGRRGNAGALSAFKFSVWDRARIDGTIREIDYAVIRQGNLMRDDTVIELTGHFPDCGFGDQTWIGTDVGGGHVRFKGVTMTSAAGNPWHDRGLKVGESGDARVGSMLVEDCDIIGRAAPVHAYNVERLTVRDTTIRGGDATGDAEALILRGGGGANRTVVENVNIQTNDRFTPTQLYGEAINPPSGEDWEITLRDVEAEVVRGLFKGKPAGRVNRTNVSVTRARFPVPDDVDWAMLPTRGVEIWRSRWGRPPTPGAFDFGRGDPDHRLRPVRGEPVLDPKKGYAHGILQYDRRYLHLGLHVLFDRKLTYASDESAEGATRIRLGISGSAPGEVEEWYRIDIAPTEKKIGTWNDHPKRKLFTEIRRQPDGKVIDARIESTYVFTHGAAHRYLLRIPWEPLGIEPEDTRISFDMAYIDYREGQREGVWALGGRTGLLGSGNPERFKHTARLYADRLDQLNAWFQEKAQNRSQ